jgi:hypothetical protein
MLTFILNIIFIETNFLNQSVIFAHMETHPPTKVNLTFIYSEFYQFVCTRISSKVFVHQRQHYSKGHTAPMFYYFFFQRHFIWKGSSYKLQRGIIRLASESSSALFKSQKWSESLFPPNKYDENFEVAIL